MGWFSKIRVFLTVAVAIVIIILAVMFSVLRAVLPHATGYRTEVAQALQSQLGLPVKITSMTADMDWLQPQLKLINVRIFDADGKHVLVAFGEVTFSISYLDSLRNMSPMVGSISLSGGDLSIVRDREGHWFVQGIPISAGTNKEISEKLVDQINNTNFSLLGSTLRLHDEMHVFHNMDFVDANIQVENLLGTHDVRVSADLPEMYGKHLQFEAKVQGDLSRPETTSAELYLDAQSIELKPLFREFGPKNSFNVNGVANTQMWLTVKNKQLKTLKTRLSVHQLKIESQDHKQQWAADSFSGSAFWQRSDDGWNLVAQDLNLTRNGSHWAQPAVVMLRDNHLTGYQVSANYLRLQDLAGLAPIISGKQYSKQANTLASMKLQGDLYNFHLAVPAGNDFSNFPSDLEVSSVFHDLGFNLAKQNISLSGLDGRLDYKDMRVHLLLASNQVSLAMDSLFSQPIMVDTLDGVIQASQKDNDWIIDADSVEAVNADIATRSRIHAVWPDNGKLQLDMQTDFHDGVGDAIANYYPVGIMSKSLLSWLKTSLSGGAIDSGSFIFDGNPGDFPFRTNQGVMEALFQARDVSLQFLPDWPALNNVSGKVRFYNQSLQIENASAQVYNGDIHDVSLDIDDLASLQIGIDGKITAPASDVQQYIWNSGLNSILGDAMHQLPMNGSVNIDLGLKIPVLDIHSGVKVSGMVRFANDVLEFPALGYQLTALNGELGFTNNSITADGLTASFNNAPLNISATTTSSPHSESIFEIKGRLPVDGLLQKYDWIPAGWLSGQSDWDVLVHIPWEKDKKLSLTASSSLQGVAVAVSDKLKKPASETLPVKLSFKLVDDGLRLEFKSQDVFDVMAARDTKKHWQLLFDAPWIKGDADFDESFDPDSVINMKLDYVDLASLVKPEKTVRGGGKRTESEIPGLKPDQVPIIHFHADKLDWGKWSFTDVSMDSQRDHDGMKIKNLTVHSKALTVTGDGTWTSNWQYPNETHLKLKVHSDQMGDALAGLGLRGSFDHGDLDASVDWNWPAEPYHFSLDALRGNGKFKLNDGQLLKIKQGAAGWLIGLLNFGNVFKEGFAFDSITGDMQFADGDVTTKNVTVKAASADMSIDGRVGLVDKDYDLHVLVTPNSSRAAFTGGTLYGGPIVGAGLVLLEKLFGIEKLTQDRYTITGHWDKPVIKKVSKGIVTKIVDKAKTNGKK